MNTHQGREELQRLTFWLDASSIRRESLDNLLAFLSKDPVCVAGDEFGWHYQKVIGGWNNRVFRVQNGELDWVLKFTRRDERRRARREFLGLYLVETAGSPFAPVPLFVDEISFHLPVIIQSWVPGRVYNRAPRSEAGLQAICDYYRDLHRIHKGDFTSELPAAFLCPRSAAEAHTMTDAIVKLIPSEKLPNELLALITRLRATKFPDWQPPLEVLLRNDPTPRNFIRQGQHLQSVDWENCGWGDAAFEIADWFAHPAYLQISMQMKKRLIEFYGRTEGDQDFNLRLGAYSQIITVWWLIRLHRYLVEDASGESQAIGSRPAGWRKRIKALYRRYMALAQQPYDPDSGGKI